MQSCFVLLSKKLKKQYVKIKEIISDARRKIM